MDEKKNFSVISIIVGIIAFIAVAFGSYFIIRNVFNAQTAAAKELAASEYEQEKKEREEERKAALTETVNEAPIEVKEPEPEREENPIHALVDVSEFMSKRGTTVTVDYSTDYFLPEDRDTSLKWEDKVFSRIENLEEPEKALINTYPVSRRQLKSSDDKEIEYEAYLYPETGTPAKLSCIEDCGDYYEVTDFYFDTEESLNYVAMYRQVVLKPAEINTAIVMSRYYIGNDTLLRYIYAEDEEALSYSLADYHKYSDGTKNQYDFLEEDIINKAYITYFTYLNTEETIKISGYVQDEFDQPLSGVSMKLTSEDGEEKKTAKTNGDGYYSFTIGTSDKTYTVSAEKEALAGQEIYNIKAAAGSGNYFADTIYMGYTDNLSVTYDVHMIVRDAISNSKIIDNADLKLRTGVNNTEGVVFASGTLDAAGTLNIPLCSGMYTAEVTKEGYETSYFNVTVKENHQSVIGYAVPEIAEGSYLAYVYWEATPFDLDCRMFGEYGKTILRSPVDSIGSVMTECFALENIGNEPYKLYISDYISCTAGNYMSYNMSASGAYVKVYSSEGLIASLTVPAAHAGVVWDALTIRDGQIYPDNKYYYMIGTDLYWTSK